VNDSPTDYKKTVNLPETSFPMQASLAKREPDMLARWEAEALYRQIDDAGQALPSYVYVDGPPYANGDIHIGHSVNKVLKDLIVKTRRLEGLHAPFVPGWDCHGLPIELQVEKKFGKVGTKLDAAAFRAECRKYALEQVERQRVDFKRLGILADWERPYLTMQPAFESEQLRVLARIVDNGHVVRGFKPVHWCLDCGSSLAEAEVEYQDKTSFAIDVRFAAADPADLGARFGLPGPADADFVIWTTTPWTLPANRAIAINAELDYALVQLDGGSTLVLAAELVAQTLKRYGAEGRVLATVSGKALEGAQARHPFADYTVPVVLGEHVTLDAGTGLVHTAPAHGVEDYTVGQRYGLAVDNPVASNGVFIDGTPLVAGLFVRKADEPIIEALKSGDRLMKVAHFDHSYPHCWRHKTPLIFRATPQWFISMEKAGLRKTALEQIEQVQWIPESGKNRIREMVATRPDWCISRQRTWGVPLAIFMDRQSQELHPDTGALLRTVADRVATDGIEAWFGSAPSDWGVDGDRYEKCNDTLDVWFDSGSVHQASFVSTGRIEPNAPAPQADLYLEGSDQHRGWFQSSLLTCVAMLGRAPYRAVLTHGFTVDEQGRKMSKSLGNVVAPQEIIKTLGADVLRLWVASADYRGEIAISNELLKRIADAYRRIRNTIRYLLGNLAGFDPATDAVAPDALLAMDRWALSLARETQAGVRQAFLAYNFFHASSQIHDFCNLTLGSVYLDVLKDRLYTTPPKSLARRSAQTVLWHLAESLVRWIAPILSYTADEIWQLLPGDRSRPVFGQTWYELPSVSTDDVDWSRLVAVRDAVKKQLESLRVQGAIGSALNAEVALFAQSELGTALASIGDELRFWFITSDVRLNPAGEPSVTVTLESGESLGISVTPSPYAKCPRCWHQRADIGSDPRHPTLCGRCVENLEGDGEQRRYI